MVRMSSTRPYLLRALYDWIVDNAMTPHLLVKADHPGVVVPKRFAKDGKIVLNISPTAVHGLRIDNDTVSFGGRFGGVAHSVNCPMAAVEAIYARENGKGMVFSPEPDGPDAPQSPRHGKPALKLVK